MPVQQPELSAFVAVARLGSFTRAATELSLTQPALSRRIRMIEQSLSASLFERLPGGARLTEAGRSFLPFAEKALTLLRDGDEAVKGIGGGDCGSIALAFVSTAGYRGVTQAVEQFRRQNGGVELSLHTGTSAEVSALVLRGDADVGLRYRPDPDSHLENRAIGEEVIEVVCSPKHPLARQKSVTPSALSEEVWIGYPYQRSAHDAGLKRMLMQYGLLSSRFMAVHSTELQIDLIAANFGIGILSHGTVAKALRSGRLKTLKVPSIRNVVPIVLIRRKGTHESVTAKKLADLLTRAVLRTAHSR